MARTETEGAAASEPPAARDAGGDVGRAAHSRAAGGGPPSKELDPTVEKVRATASPGRAGRLLIFVVAYDAESTLASVLERIPPEIRRRFDCEVLVVDDASTDRTFEIGLEYRAEHPDLALTVLRNRYNQGYGGNQKVGYRYAVLNGFDWVALLHGDGQYAPEELPRLLEPLVAGEADAVFGSRMLESQSALAGGMPLYKLVGNRILTTVQNQLLGTSLSEFHSGYRIYSVATLARLPLELNSNDFHFDTEIILELLQGGFRIRELPIPTYYGDEICRVNGLRYAWNVVRVTLQCAVHRKGLLHQRRFDLEPPGHLPYVAKLGFPSSHSFALEAVPAGAKVVDIGSGPGHVARALVAKGCEVTAVDRWPVAEDEPGIRRVTQDLDRPISFRLGDADHILILDVLEHLSSPERFLDELREDFTHRTRRLVISVPNVGFVATRLMLLLGQFNYGSRGILDRGHVRLFTFRSVLRLLRDAGLRTRRVKGVPAPFPLALGDGLLARVLLRLNQAAIAIAPGLFSYQIFVEADTTPTADYVLRDAIAATRERAVARAAEADEP